MSESNYAKKTLPKWQKKHPNARVFRNNTGMAWQGKLLTFVINGIAQKILKKLRPIFFGVGLPVKDKKTGRMIQKGGGDYIGWKSLTLCQLAAKVNGCQRSAFCSTVNQNCINCMLNSNIAVFLNLETKSKDGKESPEQIKFRKAVQEAGGISIILQEGSRNMPDIKTDKGYFDFKHSREGKDEP